MTLPRPDNPQNPLPPRPASQSVIALTQVIFPRDTNEVQLATAGVMLKTVDVAASYAAGKHCRRKVVTASLDRMDFINPARLWEMVTTRCRVTRTWRTSMEVQVEMRAENNRTGDGRLVAVGYFVLVALDDETLTPALVPPLLLETPEDERLAEEAEARRLARLAEAKTQGNSVETAIEPADNPEVVMRTMTPDDANIHHKVFGGAILELIHQSGERAVLRYVNGPVISVRQDRMSFEQPVFIGEEVIAQAVITRTWRTSLEVRVDVVARDHKTGETRKVATSYLVFVAQDAEGKPKPVPVFEPKTPRQQVRWEEAEVRREVRLSEREPASG